MADPAGETELALSLDPAAAARLLAAPELACFALPGEAPATRRLRSTYYDTPDGDLRAAGIALRIRMVDGARVQTIKARAEDGLLDRIEEERVLSGRTPVLDGIQAKALARVLGREKVARALAPAFRTDMTRTTQLLRLPSGTVEVAVDRGTIVAGALRERLCEVEIELKSGRIDAVYEAGSIVHGLTGAAIQPFAKAERAWMLLAGARPDGVRAGPVALAEGMTVADALRAIGRNCAAQIRANAALARGGTSAEVVHQLRVGLRRARTMIALFRRALPEAAWERRAGPLKAAMAQLSAARDLDVFEEGVVAPLAVAPDADPALPALAALVAARRRESGAAAAASVREPGFTLLSLDFECWVEGSGAALDLGERAAGDAAGFARAELKRLRRKAVALTEGFDTAPDERVHALRLAAKRLRYAAEFFRGLFPGRRAKAFVAALAELQEHLGQFNDAVAGLALLRRLEAESPGAVPAGALAAARAWCAALAWRERAALAAPVAAFAEAEAFWR